MHLLVTRPEPAASATAMRLRAADHSVTVAPLLAACARAWTPPDVMPAAIAFTSVNGLRFAKGLPTNVPVFAVGAATGAAARAAGFVDVRDGGGTVAMLFARARAAGVTRLLHVAGADRTIVAVPAGLRVDVATVYAAEAVALPDDVVDRLRGGSFDAVLLYSPRTAALFAAAVDAAGIDRATVAIVAISPAASIAAGDGWRAAVIAAEPNENAVFAALDRLCDKRAQR